MPKPSRTSKQFKLSSNWRSPLRLANFMLAFAITGALYLVFSQAATTPGFYGSVEKDQAGRINYVRGANGKASLQHIECLNAVAEQHTKEMVDKNKLYHTGDNNYDNVLTASEQKLLTDRVSARCGGSWSIIGENVGVGYDSGSIFNAFMNSPAHKANILDSRFAKVGVGAYYASDGRLWITQVFANCSTCTTEWSTNASLPADPVAAFSCPKVPNMTPAISLINLTQASAPGDSATYQTVTTSTEIRDYYYRSAGSRYTVAFSNHSIYSISPNAPVVSGSHAHPSGNSSATGQHQIKLDYTPLFRSNPNTTYTPKVSYGYTWNFNQSLWVKRYANNGGTRGALLYTPAESNGDGTGGVVTDNLTKAVAKSTPGSMNGPTLGPCN